MSAAALRRGMETPMSKQNGRHKQEGHWPVLLPIASQKHVPQFPLNRTAYLFGSRSPAHVALKSKLVSKSHLIIINDRGESYLRDLASTNGVYLNNQPVREARISDGDILNIGRFQFICYNGFPSEMDEEPHAAEDAELIIEGQDQPFPLRLRTMLIGRRAKCELRLDDADVSNVHAIIYRCDGRRYIRDLNSTNGTFLNSQRIRETEIRDGDVVRVGETVFRYRRAEARRGGFVPQSAAEVVEPLRLADMDEGPLDPMTDSSLEEALKASEEMEVASAAEAEDPRHARPETPRPVLVPAMPVVVPAMPTVVPAMPVVVPIVIPVSMPDPATIVPPDPISEPWHYTPDDRKDLLAEALDDFAGALSSVEAAELLGKVSSARQEPTFEEGPTPRNVDLPVPQPQEIKAQPQEAKAQNQEIKAPEWPQLPDEPQRAGMPFDPDEASDLLEDAFLRGAWESTRALVPAKGRVSATGRPSPDSDPEPFENPDFLDAL
jgi:pSer/pThr/pTyr-binding forkhead associated (FHA) protein